MKILSDVYFLVIKE